mmetsp:Transcript_755/g.958  ORF Transcript_755/g.958 Transcript_755/m.958 type:complete len:121 (+) Transcript_755:154-516(+)
MKSAFTQTLKEEPTLHLPIQRKPLGEARQVHKNFVGRMSRRHKCVNCDLVYILTETQNHCEKTSFCSKDCRTSYRVANGLSLKYENPATSRDMMHVLKDARHRNDILFRRSQTNGIRGKY